MKGHYSLVQYAENPERLEFINIGVVIFVPFGERVYFKFATSPRRVNKAFGVSLGEHYSLLVESFASRIKHEFAGRENSPSLDLFVFNRSGNIRLSPLKAGMFNEPERDVQVLYQRLVSAADVPHKRPRVDFKLRKLFRFEQVETLLEKPEKVQVKTFTLQPDYGFQNSAYNYIKAVSLRGQPDEALERISEYAIKGKLLAAEDPVLAADNRPLLTSRRLIVVGDNAEQLPDVVSEIGSVLKSHSVGFYPLDNARPLIEDIKKNYTLHGSKH